jgi:hypothetical protein
MTYNHQPEVKYRCQVLVWKTGLRCTRDATFQHGNVAMCEQHHRQFIDRQEAEHLRLKDKYAGEKND